MVSVESSHGLGDNVKPADGLNQLFEDNNGVALQRVSAKFPSLTFYSQDVALPEDLVENTQDNVQWNRARTQMVEK